MRVVTSVAGGLVILALAAVTVNAQELPVVSGKKIVATLQGETITLEDLNRHVLAARQRGSDAKMDAAGEAALLNRLIDVRLIAQEARRMDIDKLPEIRQMIDANAHVALREELVDRVIKDVKADPAEIDKAYRPIVRRWKISAALFTDEQYAKNMAAEVSAGKSFAEVAHAYLDAGKATKLEDGLVMKRDAMDPAIAQAVDGMAPGSLSSVIAVKTGFVLLRLDDILYPDDPAAKEAAERTILGDKRKSAVTAFNEALKKKYVKIDRELLKSLDFEAKQPGIEALLKDRRVLAEVQGEKPVTVGEMTEELKFKFFHGMEEAAEHKRLNAKKEQILDEMLHRRVFRKEALRLKLDKSDSYQARLKEYETSLLFGEILRRVIAPTVTLREEEVKAYYEDHRAGYTLPEMVRIKSLVFASTEAAERALDALRKGADFQWVAGQAEGQLDPNTKDVLSFDGRPIMTTELPEGVQKVVAGTRGGDVRLYASPQKHYYVLAIQDVIAAQPRPYDEVRGTIGEKLVTEKMQKAVEEYAAKLRSLSDVKVYLKGS